MTYRYDVDDLAEAAAGLHRLRGDYEDASRSRAEASGALGYDSLRGALREFVDSWEHNRGRQLEEISATAEALDAVRENYVTADEDSARNLRSS